MNIEDLNNKFMNGGVDFDNYVDEYIIDGNSYSTYRDFNTIINMGRAQRDGFEEIIYIGDYGHLIFRYKFDKGSLLPDCVYIKTESDLKHEAKEKFKMFGFIKESKVLKYNDFK